MSTFITGLEGFVGQQILSALPSSFFPVYGTAIAPVPSVPRANVCYRNVDITNGPELSAFVREAKPRIVIHLAAISNVGFSFKNPELTYKVNRDGSMNLLKALKEHCANVTCLLIGSGEVYGNSAACGRAGCSESDPVSPVSPYAKSKLAMETDALALRKECGIDVRITRSFNHTGPGQGELFVFSYIAKTLAEIKLGRKKPELELGNIDVRRDFLDVRDTVSAYLAILQKGRPGETYNVSSGKSPTLRELINTFIRVSGLPVRIVTDASRMRPQDIPLLCGNSAKLKKETGWQPQYAIEDTFKDMLAWWEKKIQ